jgi:hypothetical protein
MARRRRSSTRPTPANEIGSTESVQGTAGRPTLVVVRESIVGPKLFTQMLSLVVNSLSGRGIPGLIEAKQVGVSVFKDPAVQATLGAEPFYRTGGRAGARPLAWHFEIHGTHFLFVMMSADAVNEAEENDFSRILETLVRRLKPALIATGPGSRLCRNRDHVAAVNAAIRHARAGLLVQEVYHQGPLDLHVVADRKRWDDICQSAVSDYEATRSRLTSGTATMLVDGCWPKGESTLPLGYRFTEPDSHVVCREVTLTSAVRAVVAATAADYSVDEDGRPRSLAEQRNCAIVKVVDAVAESGWVSGKAKSLYAAKYGGDASAVTVRDVKNPRSLVDSIWRWLPTYQTGIYVYRQETTLGMSPHATDYLGVALEHEFDEDGHKVRSELVHPIVFHSEDDGWGIDPELMQRALEKVQEYRSRGHGGARGGLQASEFKPLAGIFTWTCDAFEYRLSAKKKGAYQIQRRPLADAYVDSAQEQWQGWSDGPNEETLANVRADVLHVLMADAVAAALEGGVGAERLGRLATISSSAAGGHSNEISRLTAEIERQQKLSRHHRGAAAESAVDGNSEGEASSKELAKSAEREITRLRSRLRALEAAGSGPAIPRGEQVDLGSVATVLSLLRETTDKAPRALHDALRQLFASGQFTVDGLVVRGSLHLLIPIDGGALRLGPVLVSTPNFARVGQDESIKRLAERYFRDGWSLERLADETAFAATVIRAWLLRWVKATVPSWAKGKRAAAVDCPIAATRQALWELMTGEPSGQDAEWVEHLRTSYASGRGDWVLSWAAETHVKRRQWIAAVACLRGDEGPVRLTDVMSAVDSDGSGDDTYLFGKKRSNNTRVPPAFDLVGGWGQTRGARAERFIDLMLCQTCGTRTATHALRVPEVPEGLLCTTCRRQPSGGVVFTEEYMLPWEREGSAVLGPNTPGAPMSEDETDIDRRLALKRANSGLAHSRSRRYLPEKVEG